MTDCLIIGAGPAGLSAAIACGENGLKTTVIDEFMKPGGRLLGQLHEEPNNIWWNGCEEAEKLYKKAVTLPITLLLQTSVYNIEKKSGHWHVHTNKGSFKADLLLIATGAAEKSMPVPGWTLPGVMSIGAAQVMANVHHVKPGHHGVIVGVNVLSLAIARELALAGVKIEGIYLPVKNPATLDQAVPTDVFKSLLNFTHLAPSAFLKAGGYFARRSSIIQTAAVKMYPKNGFKVWGIPIKMRQAITQILGNNKAEKVCVSDISSSGRIIENSERELSIDFVCIAGGLYPLAELASIAGCPFKYIPSLGGHVPIHNEFMKTPLDGLYVAGNITGIESAKVAIAQGTLAGMAMALAKNKSISKQRINQAIQNVKTTREKALIQFHPDIQKGRDELQVAATSLKNQLSKTAI